MDEHSLKIILLGDDFVGKTTLRRAYMGKGFDENYNKTLGVDISHYAMTLQNTKFHIVIWDLAGDKSFRQIRNMYCQGADGAVLVVDVTKDINIETLLWWLEDINKITDPETIFPVVLVGNKIDLENSRKLSRDNLLATESLIRVPMPNLDILVAETSAKTGENVKEVFEWLVKKIFKNTKI